MSGRQVDGDFVPLAGVTSADNLPSAIANALKLSFYGAEDLEIQLHNYLGEKHLLLVLDNFEHLVAGARTVANLLVAALDVKILLSANSLSLLLLGLMPRNPQSPPLSRQLMS